MAFCSGLKNISLSHLTQTGVCLIRAGHISGSAMVAASNYFEVEGIGPC